MAITEIRSPFALCRLVALGVLTLLAPPICGAADAASPRAEIPVQVHIIGFGMSAADRAALEQAAREGGATFEHVEDVRGLDGAMAGASGWEGVVTRSEEAEPNDNFGHANDIAPAGVFSGSIQPRGDSDWLRLRVNNQGELHLLSEAVPADLDLAVRLWNANRDVQVNWVSAPAKGGVLEATMDLPAPGEYVLELRDGRNDAGSGDPYRIRLAFTPTADRGENNDQFGRATPIPTDADIQANILPKGDSDWYAVDVPAQGQLDVTITSVPVNLDLSYRVWNSNRDVSHNWISPLAKGGETHGINDLPRAGRYVIEVRDGRNDDRSPDPYRLQLAFRSSADVGEPNNGFGQASVLAPDAAVSATILPKGDSDWYRVQVGDQGQLDVAIAPVPADLDVQFRVWNANRDVLHNWLSPLSTGGPNVQSADLPAAGVYTLEVRDGRDDARSVEPYRLGLTFQATGDSAEPNNSFGAAARVALGSTVRATILPRGDVDWYRVDVPVAGELQIEIADVAADLDIQFRVWNANRDVARNWVAPLAKGGNSAGSVGLKEPGRYYIEVRDGRDDARSIQAYRLTARMGVTH